MAKLFDPSVPRIKAAAAAQAMMLWEKEGRGRFGRPAKAQTSLVVWGLGASVTRR